jgi:hypothetical protein
MQGRVARAAPAGSTSSLVSHVHMQMHVRDITPTPPLDATGLPSRERTPVLADGTAGSLPSLVRHASPLQQQQQQVSFASSLASHHMRWDGLSCVVLITLLVRVCGLVQISQDIMSKIGLCCVCVLQQAGRARLHAHATTRSALAWPGTDAPRITASAAPAAPCAGHSPAAPTPPPAFPFSVRATVRTYRATTRARTSAHPRHQHAPFSERLAYTQDVEVHSKPFPLHPPSSCICSHLFIGPNLPGKDRGCIFQYHEYAIIWHISRSIRFEKHLHGIT